jgi:hypothetical protein
MRKELRKPKGAMQWLKLQINKGPQAAEEILKRSEQIGFSAKDMKWARRYFGTRIRNCNVRITSGEKKLMWAWYSVCRSDIEKATPDPNRPACWSFTAWTSSCLHRKAHAAEGA